MTEPASTKPYGNVPGFPPDGEIDLRTLLASPIELEIGFGKGHFLLQRAEQNPETWLVGIETRRKWVHLVDERAERRQLDNVVLRYGDARRVLPRIVPAGCLQRVFVNFPDPWWKARHAKRVLVTAELAEQVSRLLVDGGEFFLQTDVDLRAQHYLGILHAVPDLERVASAGAGEGNPYGIRSTRENRCREIGLTVQRFLFRRARR